MPTSYKGTPAEVRALNSYIKLMRATDTVSSMVRDQVAAFDLTESQFAVLEALFHLGPLRASELAHKLLRSGGNVTTVIDNLEKSGLVERRKCPDDRRGVRLALTTAGRDRIRRVFPSVAGRITGLMSALEPAEQDELARITRKLGTGISQTRR
jgi:MarR family 2-MHQ and catechol resistance regulon transcriptional repressor